MLIVIFLPGGLVEGANRISKWLRSWGGRGDAETQPSATPAE